MGGDYWFSVSIFETAFGLFSCSAARSVTFTKLSGQGCQTLGSAAAPRYMRMGFVFGHIPICFSTIFFHLFIFSTDIKYLEHKMTNLPLQPLCFEAIWESLKLLATYSPVSFIKASYISILLLPSNCLFTTEPPL